MPRAKGSPARLSIEIEQEQHNAMQKLIPYGQKVAIFRKIVDDLILLLESNNPYDVTSQIMKDEIKLTHVSNESPTKTED